jgi:hypothetical protein
VILLPCVVLLRSSTPAQMLGVVVVSTFRHYVGITCLLGIDSNCVHYVNLHSVQLLTFLDSSVFVRKVKGQAVPVPSIS